MAKIQIQCAGLRGYELVDEYARRHHFTDEVGRNFALHSARCDSAVTLVPIVAGACRREGESGMVLLTAVLSHTREMEEQELFAVPFEAALLYLDGPKPEEVPMQAVYLGARADLRERALYHHFLAKNDSGQCFMSRLSQEQVGRHCLYSDTVIVFAEKTDETREREAALEELAALGQEIGVGYE